MEFREDNFFPTELPKSDRYSLELQVNKQSESMDAKNKIPSIRVREIKKQMKKAADSYNKTIKDFMKTKNSLSRTYQKTNDLRHKFIKLYSSKKVKFAHQSLLESAKSEQEQYHQVAANRARNQKINNEMSLMFTRNENETNNMKVKEKNKLSDEKLKKMLKMKRLDELEAAKQKYLVTKRGETEFLIRKKNMSAMVSAQARHNYLLKINQEIETLDDYSKFLEKFNGLILPEAEIINTTGESFSKTFFATTRGTFSKNL